MLVFRAMVLGLVVTLLPVWGDDALAERFADPPASMRPWVYWWWHNANVTERSITQDLEAMAVQGVGGFLLFDVTAYGQHLLAPPARRIDFMSDQWRALVRHALREAGRLGLQASINLSTCGGALRAPWDMGENAVKRLVWSAATVRGPASVALPLPKSTAPHFQPVALVAGRLATKAESKPEFSAWLPLATRIPKGAATVLETLDLSGRVVGDTLVWDVPAGDWRILRFGCVVMAARREDVDVLNPAAVEAHFDRMGRALIADAGPLAGKTLTHFYNVSWEGVSPSWTPGFEKDFQAFRGYEAGPYLPALAGLIVKDGDTTRRFHRDFALSLSDAFMTNCYARFDQLCKEAGLRWHSEAGGPSWSRGSPLFRAADQLAFWGRNAMPQGEFWVPGYRSNMRRAAMAAHVYGKQLVAVEAFTHMSTHWSQYPGSLKRSADLALCDGANQFVWHTSSASPDEYGLPGIVYFAGTHVNRNVTWFRHAKGFFDYLARGQIMLRQGQFVADVACYMGDGNYEQFGRGKTWRSGSALQLPKGYSFDLLNSEVLAGMQAENSELVLASGMRYRLLVLDPATTTVPVADLRRIVALVEAGATLVLGERQPTRAPGLAGHPESTREVAELVAKLWGPGSVRRRLGKGTVVVGAPLPETLDALGMRPDFIGTDEYIHRRDGDMDIYFVAGSGRVDLSFRVTGREPEIWDPLDGSIRRVARTLETVDGRTVLPVTMPQNGSLFVVFRRAAREPRVVGINGPKRITMRGREGDAARVRFWQNGEYTFTSSRRKTTPVKLAGIPDARELSGPWTVGFTPGWGAPESVALPKLVPWSDHENPDIRFYSGTATYRLAFNLSAPESGSTIRLQLGKVGCIARVRLNDREAGVVWTTPWEADLTGLAKVGDNVLEVEVANVWKNRLIGDAALPPEKRRARTNVGLEKGKRTKKRCQTIASTDALMPSGLMGPVVLEFGREQLVGF